MANQQVGRYLIKELLGEGGMARVYKGYDPQLSRNVAIKIINSALADSEDYQLKFRREANIVAKLEDLAVVPIYDFGEEGGGTLYIVMRLMEGGTLAQRLEKQKSFSLEQTINTIDRLSVTLDKVHQNDVVHLDLKTSNILYNTNDEAFIADFGIARFQQAVTRSGRSLSAFTPKYASPEQIDDDNPGIPSDLYSFGLIVYEMLAGRLPFEASKPTQWMRQHAEAPVANIRDFRPDLPIGIEEVFYKILAKDPVNRYINAQTFVNDLKLVAQGKKALASGAKTLLSSRAQKSATEKAVTPTAKGNFRWVLPIVALVIILGLGSVILANLGIINFGFAGAASTTGTISNTPVNATSIPNNTPIDEPLLALTTQTTTPSSTPAPTENPSETPIPTLTSRPTLESTKTKTPTPEPTFTATTEPTATLTPTEIVEGTVSDENLVGSGVQITQQTGGTGLQVFLLDPEGSGWNNAYMAIFEQQLDVNGNTTNGNRVADGRLNNLGSINFDLTPGDYIVCPGDVQGYGFTPKGCVHNVSIERGSVTTVKLQAGRLDIAVVNADGLPMEGLYSYVATQKADVSGNPVEDQRVAEGRVNNTGLVSYVLTPGLYLVAMDLPGYNWGTAPRDNTEINMRVGAGETNRRIISMGGLIIGLTSADGSPAEGVYFQVFTQRLDVSGNPVLADRVAEGRTDNGGLAGVVLTQGNYALQIDDNTLYNITIEWGKNTVTDGVAFEVQESE